MWRKSSRSVGANCIEVMNWRKPRRSVGNGACLEAGNSLTGVLVRDTQDRAGVVLQFGSDAWTVFLSGVKNVQSAV